jgi:predicted transcriptional regulator
MSMTIELPTETAQALATIARGKGKSAEEYAREILENEVFTSNRIEELRLDVQVGLEAIESGRFTDYNSVEDLINDVRREGDKRLGRKV